MRFFCQRPASGSTGGAEEKTLAVEFEAARPAVPVTATELESATLNPARLDADGEFAGRGSERPGDRLLRRHASIVIAEQGDLHDVFPTGLAATCFSMNMLSGSGR
jgi:hypothetical protein